MRNYGLVVLALVGSIAMGACSEDEEDDTIEYKASLTGTAERPTQVNTTATGNFTMRDNGANMSYVLTVNGITGPITGAHIHAIPRSAALPTDTVGGIVIDLLPNVNVTTGILAQGTFTANDIRPLAGAPVISMDSLRTLIDAGRTYVNVHTAANLAGHIRGTIVRD